MFIKRYLYCTFFQVIYSFFLKILPPFGELRFKPRLCCQRVFVPPKHVTVGTHRFYI
uniref:Uncharacterized protein n=1 Tax=uncultured marine virus TaxID=186617 RepID=A0A0F7L2M2_9VIRU|nr:hypothetical protein [uncultured marine virus]